MLDSSTLFDYDVFGNLLSVTDARSNVTTFTYDRWDRNYVETKSSNSRTMLMDALGQCAAHNRSQRSGNRV